MTAVNLLPLAPKATTLASQIEQVMTNANKNNMAPLPMVAPQSLLLYPEVLVRASMAESLLHQRQAQAQAPRAPASPLFQSATMAYATYKQSQEHQQTLQKRLQLELLQNIQASSSSSAAAKTPAPLAAKKDIIGMGICIPKPEVPAPLVKPSVVRKQPRESVKRMMMFGNPLKAPPPLANKIYKKRSSPASASVTQDNAPYVVPTKRRKVEEAPSRVSLGVLTPPMATKKALSSEELEFLQAAQRLHEISNSPRSTPLSRSPLLLQKAALTSKALKPPPSLGL